MKALIVYNPMSGKRKFAKHLDYLISVLEKKYETVDVYRSMSKMSITTYIEENGSNYDLLVVSGGDGTLNEAINGLMHIDKKPVLDYIPCGTVNDVGHMLKMKTNVRKAINLVLTGEIVEMDICKIQDKYFTYASAVGKFTNVSYDVSSSSKKVFGKMAYFLAGVKCLGEKDTMNMSVKTPFEAWDGKYFVIIALNSLRVAGFSLHRKKRPKLNDGIIDVTFVSKMRWHFNLLNLGGFFLFGDAWKSGVKTIQTNEIILRSDNELNYNVDGEFACCEKEVKIEVVPKAIKIIVGSKTKKRFFM